MRHLLLVVALLAILVSPQLVLGADLDDLKATNEKMLKAFVSLDAATIASMIHPGAVNFESIFPMVAPMENAEAQLTALYKSILGSLESLYIVPYTMQYKVVGNTGIAWGHATMYSKPKGGLTQTRYVRMSSTWVKSNGKWLVLLAHQSNIPQGE